MTGIVWFGKNIALHEMLFQHPWHVFPHVWNSLLNSAHFMYVCFFCYSIYASYPSHFLIFLIGNIFVVYSRKKITVSQLVHCYILKVVLWLSLSELQCHWSLCVKTSVCRCAGFSSTSHGVINKQTPLTVWIEKLKHQSGFVIHKGMKKRFTVLQAHIW